MVQNIHEENNELNPSHQLDNETKNAGIEAITPNGGKTNENNKYVPFIGAGKNNPWKSFESVSSVLQLFKSDSKDMGIFSHLRTRTLLKSVPTAVDDEDTNLKENEMLGRDEKDYIISNLKYQISQRDSVIKQLEDLIFIQKNLLKLDHSAPQKLRRESEKQNLAAHSSNRELEADKLVDVLSKSIEEHNEKIKFVEQELVSRKKKLKENEEGIILELKRTIEEMQRKLEDQNNTNFTLIQSIKLANETIADLRSSNERLQKAE